MADINKVKTPFTTKQRSQLKKWSKFAKEESLASPYARKVLYEAGSYNFIFVSRLGKLVEILNILKDHLDEVEVQDLDDCCSVSYGTFLNAKANEADPHTQYEKAKIDEVGRDDMVQQIDGPSIPTKLTSPKRLLSISMSLVFGIFLSIFFIYFKEKYSSFSDSN